MNEFATMFILGLVMITHGAPAQLNGTTPIDCSNNETTAKMYPSPTNCSTYYQCVNGSQVEYTCPSNLQFNAQLGACDFPKYVNCKENATAPADNGNSTGNLTVTTQNPYENSTVKVTETNETATQNNSVSLSENNSSLSKNLSSNAADLKTHNSTHIVEDTFTVGGDEKLNNTVSPRKTETGKGAKTTDIKKELSTKASQSSSALKKVDSSKERGTIDKNSTTLEDVDDKVDDREEKDEDEEEQNDKHPSPRGRNKDD